jgi:hypothetical protein
VKLKQVLTLKLTTMARQKIYFESRKEANKARLERENEGVHVFKTNKGAKRRYVVCTELEWLSGWYN